MPVRPGTLENLGIHQGRWESVERLVTTLVDDGTLPGLSLQVVRHRCCLAEPVIRGRQSPQDGLPPLREDALFLVASLTKPVVAMAALLLVERGQVSLSDRVVDLIPEFEASSKRPITLRHLLTHTSGLPDMLPNNRALREANSPLSSFLEGTCAVSLDFAPGHGVQYQSMGFLLLGEIIRRVSGRPCGEFVNSELFEPLGMSDSVLGAPDDWYQGTPPKIARIAGIRVPVDQQQGSHWNWNSRYWQQLGAPWGGMISTPADLAAFGLMMLTGSQSGDDCPLAVQTIRQATTNQLLAFSNVPEADRRTRPWGLGWRLNWPAQSASFGDLLSSQAYGHWGATGTLFWLDPELDAAAVILSTQPLDQGRSHLTRISNAIVASFV